MSSTQPTNQEIFHIENREGVVLADLCSIDAMTDEMFSAKDDDGERWVLCWVRMPDLPDVCEIADTILDLPVGTRVRISGSFMVGRTRMTLDRATGKITHAWDDFCIELDDHNDALSEWNNHAVWTEMQLFEGALTYCEVLHVPDETDESIDADIDDCRMNTTIDGRYIAANKEQPETHLVSLTFEQAEYIADCMKERPDCKVAQGIFGEVLEVIV